MAISEVFKVASGGREQRDNYATKDLAIEAAKMRGEGASVVHRTFDGAYNSHQMVWPTVGTIRKWLAGAPDWNVG